MGSPPGWPLMTTVRRAGGSSAADGTTTVRDGSGLRPSGRGDEPRRRLGRLQAGSTACGAARRARLGSSASSARPRRRATTRRRARGDGAPAPRSAARLRLAGHDSPPPAPRSSHAPAWRRGSGSLHGSSRRDHLVARDHDRAVWASRRSARVKRRLGIRSKMSSPTPQSATARRRGRSPRSRGRTGPACGPRAQGPWTRPLLLAYGVELVAHARRAALRQPDRFRSYQRPKRLHALCVLHQPPDDSEAPTDFATKFATSSASLPVNRPAGIWPLPLERPFSIASSVICALGASASRSGPTHRDRVRGLERVAEAAAGPEQLLPVLLVLREAGHLGVREILVVVDGGDHPRRDEEPEQQQRREERQRRETPAAARLRVQHRAEAAAPAAHGEQQRAQAQQNEGEDENENVLTGPQSTRSGGRISAVVPRRSSEWAVRPGGTRRASRPPRGRLARLRRGRSRPPGRAARPA